MLRVREIYEHLKSDSGWTLHQLGLRMGYDENTARKGAHQFLNGRVPRIDTLRKFAQAVSIPLAELVAEKKGRGK